MNLVDGGSNSSGSYFITGLAILGILLGGAGLYVGLAARGDKAQENRLAELEQRVDRLGGAVEELNGQLRGLHHNTRTALQGINEQLTQVRQEARAARGTPAASQPAPSPAPTPGAAPAAGAAAPVAAKTYTIRAGDLLAKIARDNGTTVDAILKANPGLNPNRIKVGQVINLP